MKYGTISRWSRNSETGSITDSETGQEVFFLAGSLCDPKAIPAPGLAVMFKPGVNRLGPIAYHVQLLEKV
jgi:hypothetical protein